MEIALLSRDNLKIKGKSATLSIGQPDKSTYNARLLLEATFEGQLSQDEQVTIVGPGEYEVGGIKIVGIRSDSGMIYTLIVDTVSIAVGKLLALSQMQSKLQDQDILVAQCETAEAASFLTSLASHVVILYGDLAAEVAQTFGKEHVQMLGKYTTTKEKLPAEVETILLQ